MVQPSGMALLSRRRSRCLALVTETGDIPSMLDICFPLKRNRSRVAILISFWVISGNEVFSRVGK